MFLLASLASVYLLAVSAEEKAEASYHLVTRVIDGDTIIVGEKERVRLIGVDTPETVHPKRPVERYGKEASAFTTRMVEGKKVTLEYDGGVGRRDRYGRTLAYVRLPDGRLLNLEIIRQGYGFAYTRFPFKRMEEFRAAEKKAREAARGLWGVDVLTTHVVEDSNPSRESFSPSADMKQDQSKPVRTGNTQP